MKTDLNQTGSNNNIWKVHPMGLSINADEINGSMALFPQNSLKLLAPRMILCDSVKVNSHHIQYIYVCSLQIIIKMWEIAKEMSFTLTKAL